MCGPEPVKTATYTQTAAACQMLCFDAVLEVADASAAAGPKLLPDWHSPRPASDMTSLPTALAPNSIPKIHPVHPSTPTAVQKLRCKNPDTVTKPRAAQRPRRELPPFLFGPARAVALPRRALHPTSESTRNITQREAASRESVTNCASLIENEIRRVPNPCRRLSCTCPCSCPTNAAPPWHPPWHPCPSSWPLSPLATWPPAWSAS
mmetsp:Transcript_113774/g.170169  ORF Transcript_113774/g.170169 Transcript_113774/m.170169 type:complete len:207 (+) Transcript_113774:121-741(+)